MIFANLIDIATYADTGDESCIYTAALRRYEREQRCLLRF